MTHIQLDRGRCEGHGLCEQLAPQVYRLDEDGYPEILVEPVPSDLRQQAEAGARVCPVTALRVTA